MGVWIEIPCMIVFCAFEQSHPLWVCGLKFKRDDNGSPVTGHTLYGCVDCCTRFLKSLYVYGNHDLPYTILQIRISKFCLYGLCCVD